MDYCPLGNDYILLAMRLFSAQWAGKKVLIRCNNDTVVSVLNSGKARDPFLAASARNIWYISAVHDIDVQYCHIKGLDNAVADVLSRWQGTPKQIQKLHSNVSKPVWLHVSKDLLQIDPVL